MKLLKRLAIITLPILAWTTFVGYGFINGFLLKPITSEDSPMAFLKAVQEKIDHEFVGNLALILIENGELSESYFYSIGHPINEKSVFPVASISKWVTSFGVLKLVEQGKLNLDKPIDDYLTRWHLPESEFDNNEVTARRLLSHSSGLIDDLGYSGFAADEKLQTIEESLKEASDAPYSEGIARLGFEPGSMYMYSGAGYTILQLLIEEISGRPFEDYMQEEVFRPLNMGNSTFAPFTETKLQLVPIYKNDGDTRPPRKFTARAAAALLTSSEDLAKFLLANVSENPVLKSTTIEEMGQPETYINKTPVYGLGPHLYSQNDQASRIIGHDGSGNDAINTAARMDLYSKNGIIILETGSFNIASTIADEWMFWKAGIADYVVMMRNKSHLLILLFTGYITIVLSIIFILRKTKIKAKL